MVGPEHLVLLLRVALCVTFAASALAKLRDVPAFQAAVEDFDVVPRRFAATTALLVVGAEAVLVIMLAVGGAVLAPAFALATVLLAVFTAALARALHHRSVASCNCFGTATARLSRYDLVRNACLIACSCAGAALAFTIDRTGVPGAQVAVIAPAGCSLALVLVNFSDIARTLGRALTVPGTT
jgi:uncharacterized membrane protein YphA (DoxX/SURF4 family)